MTKRRAPKLPPAVDTAETDPLLGRSLHDLDRTATTFESSFFPGVFTTNATIFRYELDTYAPGYSDAIDRLATLVIKPEAELAGAFFAHLDTMKTVLGNRIRTNIQTIFGSTGELYPPEGLETRVLSQTHALHQIPKHAPREDFLADMREIVLAEREASLHTMASLLGIGYAENDEDFIANSLMQIKQTVCVDRAEQLSELIARVDACLDVTEKENPDGGLTELSCDIDDSSALTRAAKKLRNTLTDVAADPSAWLLADANDYLKKYFYVSSEQETKFLHDVVARHIKNCADKVRALIDYYNQNTPENVVELDTNGTVDRAELFVVPMNIDLSKVDYGCVAQVQQSYPWIAGGAPSRKGLLPVSVAGQQTIYYASAVSGKKLRRIVEESEESMKEDVFKDMTANLLAAVASGRRHKNVSAKKLNGKVRVTPYDDFTLELREDMGSGARLYFVRTTVGTVVSKEQCKGAGIDPDAALVVTVAKTNKDNQPQAIEILNGTPARTSRKNGAGAV